MGRVGGFESPPKFSDFFWKSEGKEVEKKRKKKWEGMGVGPRVNY